MRETGGRLGLPMGQWNTTPSGGPPPIRISYWQLAYGHKLLLTVFLLLGILGGTVFVILKTPRYSAATVVELVGFNQSFMNMNQVDPQAGTDMTTASVSNIQTQTRLLTGRSLLARVTDRLSLEMTPVTTPPMTLFGKLHAHLPYGQKEPLEQIREALNEAAYTVSARGVGSTRLIEIQCDSTSPEVAANFLNTLTAEHISQNLAARASTTQRTSQWMESQLEEARSRLQQAGEKLRDFVRQSGMDFFPEQSTLADSKLRQLQADLASIQADRVSKQARWEMAKSATLDTLPDILADAGLQSLKARLIELRRDRAEKAATLMPAHEKMLKIQAQITEIEQTLEKEKAGFLRRVESEYKEALRRETLLRGAYSAQTHAVSGQADKASQYTMLKRDVDMSQQLYNTLLQQSNQAALVALVPTSNIRVVDAAIVSSIPSSPVPMRDIPLWGFLSGALGYGLLWMREVRKRKKSAQLFDTPGDTRVILGVPELGVIPSAEVTPARRAMKLRMPFRGLPVEANGNGTNSPTGNLELASWQQKSSVLAESFRQTLTSILRAKPKDHSPLYVITSVGPGEGKTTLTANLAIAMSEIGQRVLLVDADLRRPRQHTLFGLNERKGLSDILSSSEPLSGAWFEDMLNATEVNDKLWVMTHGLMSVETPASLFFSPRVQELVAVLRKRFDYILLDTPPVLPFPDARLWGKNADGIVLIVRAGITTQEGAMSVCNRFLEDGVPVLGTILNDWSPKEGSQGYAYYSYEAYQRGYR